MSVVERTPGTGPYVSPDFLLSHDLDGLDEESRIGDVRKCLGQGYVSTSREAFPPPVATGLETTVEIDNELPLFTSEHTEEDISKYLGLLNIAAFAHVVH